jgi:AraC-like DNA-binding protein
VGYSNPSKFTSAFESCMGTTPSEWRATHSRSGS